jgi:hypothetical protein
MLRRTEIREGPSITKPEVIMKKNFFLAIFTVALLCLYSVMPVWAYKVTVTSELTEDDGNVFTAVRWIGNAHNFNDGYGLAPGQTESFSNDDWHNTGLCWDDVGVKPANTWTGCPARQWKYTIVTKCSDMNVILKRSGCNVDVYVH